MPRKPKKVADVPPMETAELRKSLAAFFDEEFLDATTGAPISERKVQGGLRRTLSVQAKRLEWLAKQRFMDLGGESTVEVENVDAETDHGRSEE